MDPDKFSLIIDLDEDSDWDDDEEPESVSAAHLEGELMILQSLLRGAQKELEGLKVQATFLDPLLPPAFPYVEEVNENELKRSFRACEYRIRRYQAQISNLNRKLVSAKRAEEHGLDVARVLNVEERTLFVLGIGNDHCPSEVVKSMFKVYGDVEEVTMYKRHCLVTFMTKEGADKALIVNGTKPLGRRVRARPKLEPYALSSMPLTLPWAEPSSFSFSFTFSVPRVPPPPMAPLIHA